MPIMYCPIPDFPGYSISHNQNVYSKWKAGRRRRSRTSVGWESRLGDTWTRLEPWIMARGYLGVTLRREGVYHRRLIHRLMLEVFVGSCPDDMEGCHRDGNKMNNHTSNLYWGTHFENMQDSKRHGTTTFGEKNPQSKLIEEDVLKMVDIINEKHAKGYRQGISYDEIGEMFGVTGDTVKMIANGTNWSYLTVGKLIVSKRNVTEEDVREIVNLRQQGWSVKDIAAEFNVHETTIFRIFSGQTWSHVTGIPHIVKDTQPVCLVREPRR